MQVVSARGGGEMGEWMGVWTDGWTYRWMEGSMNRWMGRQMDGWTDRWTERSQDLALELTPFAFCHAQIGHDEKIGFVFS